MDKSPAALGQRPDTESAGDGGDALPRGLPEPCAALRQCQSAGCRGAGLGGDYPGVDESGGYLQQHLLREHHRLFHESLRDEAARGAGLSVGRSGLCCGDGGDGGAGTFSLGVCGGCLFLSFAQFPDCRQLEIPAGGGPRRRVQPRVLLAERAVVLRAPILLLYMGETGGGVLSAGLVYHERGGAGRQLPLAPAEVCGEGKRCCFPLLPFARDVRLWPLEQCR